MLGASNMSSWLCVLCFTLPLVTACGDDAPVDGASQSDGSSQTAGTSGGRRSGVVGGAGAGGAAASRTGDCGTGEPEVDTLDLLLVMDDSGSMGPLQEHVRQQIPHLLDVLATGDLDDDGAPEFTKVRDFHLGVVSTDMGLVGIQGIDKCSGLGEDGILRNMPGARDPFLPAGDSLLPDCEQATYPSFLTYTPDVEVDEMVALNFGCMARLGIDGCGFEQQMEAMLKALWPSVDLDPATGEPIVPDRITFLGNADGTGTRGHGDQENAGFLRLDPREGRSLLAVLMITDEEDCSSSNTAHFAPPALLEPADPLREQDLNLRCLYNKQNLYPIERYVNGLAALRPGAEHLVVFGAIAGVPVELVDAAARAAVDFEDTASREKYYQGILDAAAMQEQEDLTRPPGQGNLVPSCEFDTDGDGMADRKAYPPRRIVELARGMGSQGMIGSICQADLRDPVDAFLETIASALDGASDPGIPGVCDPFLHEPPQAQPRPGGSPSPNGPRCGGVSEACFTQSDLLACMRVEGCFWSNVSENCTGSSRFCVDYADQLSCDRQPGCEWR